MNLLRTILPVLEAVVEYFKDKQRLKEWEQRQQDEIILAKKPTKKEKWGD
jgi:hypothetical protein